MCGIAGIVSTDASDTEQRSSQLATMLNAIQHRGPDGQGTWNDPCGYAGLAQCRLAIIDLSPQGNQPMCAACGDKVLVFNGEIYNYLELREELKADGITFRGESDTEVLLNGLCHWGVNKTLKRLVGMFAFGMWDKKQRVLHLARDRAGKKPLYYFSDGKHFYFASEIKAIQRVPGLDLQRNRESIYHYLSLGFVPAPATIYKNLLELMPGHGLRVDSDLQLNDYQYWEFPTSGRSRLSVREAAEEAEIRLIESVKLRLRSDVPIGVFLSGGIDSGLITGIAAQHSSRPIQTFTVGFDSQAMDESPLARQVACQYGTDHHELRLTCNVPDLLKEVADVYDQPFADPSALPTLAIARETSRHVKVVLNGEGGDELFGGYRRHQAAKYFSLLKRLGGNLALKLLRAAGGIAPSPRSFRSGYSFFYRFLQGLDSDPFLRYIIWSTDGFDDAEKRWLLRDAGANVLPTETCLARRYQNLDGLEPLDHFMAVDFLLGMSDCLLVKMDMATMAYGLEARSPFLDHRLVEWAGTVARSTVLSGISSKPILRTMARRYLPDEIVRSPKRGFDVPLMEWTKQFLGGIAIDLCLSEGGIALEIFERQRLRSLLERRSPLNTESWTKQVWLLLVLAMWDHHGAKPN